MSDFLEVKELDISFRQDNKIIRAVKNISFSLEKGEILAIVGESGAGKSVAAQSIPGLLPKNGTNIKGSVLFKGKELIGADDKALRKIRGNEISFVFQEPGSALNPLQRVEKQIGEIIDIHRAIGRVKKKEEILSLLELVHIDAPESKLKSYPHELSGGQKQRILIAMAVANNPDLLIADEPTTALDVKIQAQVMKLIRELQQKIKMSVIIVSHNIEMVKKFADRVCVMKDGEIVEQGKINKIFFNPDNKYTKKLVDLEEKSLFPKTHNSGKNILKADNINVKYCVKKRFLKNRSAYFNAVNSVSFNVNQGENLGIVGESGSGKSSLAMALLQLTEFTGEITFNNKRMDIISQGELSGLRKDIQVVFQDPYNSLNPRMTIKRIIGEGLEKHMPDLKKHHERLIKEVLRNVGLEEDVINRYPHEFSGGERQRIAIARAVVLKPELIILDEPTSALDRPVQFQVLELLKRLQQELNLTYIFISHDLKLVRSICHRIIVMNKGKICEQGKTENIFSNPLSQYTKELIAFSCC